MLRLFSKFVKSNFLWILVIFHIINQNVEVPSFLFWWWITGKKFIIRSSQQKCSAKKGVLRNFTKFTGKHLCQSLSFETLAQDFSCEFCKICKNTFIQNTSGQLILHDDVMMMISLSTQRRLIMTSTAFYWSTSAKKKHRKKRKRLEANLLKAYLRRKFITFLLVPFDEKSPDDLETKRLHVYIILRESLKKMHKNNFLKSISIWVNKSQ